MSKKDKKTADYSGILEWTEKHAWQVKTADAVGVLQFLALLEKRRSVRHAREWGGVGEHTFLELDKEAQLRWLEAHFVYETATSGQTTAAKKSWLLERTCNEWSHVNGQMSFGKRWNVHPKVSSEDRSTVYPPYALYVLDAALGAGGKTAANETL